MPELLRKMPDSSDQSMTVVSAAQSPKLFGYHPPDWLAGVNLQTYQKFSEPTQGYTRDRRAKAWNSIPKTEGVNEPIPSS